MHITDMLYVLRPYMLHRSPVDGSPIDLTDIKKNTKALASFHDATENLRVDRPNCPGNDIQTEVN